MAKIDEVLDEAKAAGVSEDVAKNFFYAAVQKDPSFANLDARQIVQGAKATALRCVGNRINNEVQFARRGFNLKVYFMG